MCELATISAAAAVIGTAVSVYGAMEQGQAQKSAANYQAQVARNNATVADQNAAAVRDQAASKQQVLMRAGEQRLGAQRAAMAAGGGVLDSGSSLDVQDATVRNTALGGENVDYEGQLAAYGYRAQGGNFNAQAGLSQLSGDNAQSASYLTAASSFLGGASQVASKWDAYRRAGGFSSNVGGGSPQSGGLY